MAAKGALVIRFIGDTKEFDRATRQMQSGVSKVGKVAAAGFAVAAAGLVAAATKAVSFDKTMRQVGAAADISGSALKKMSDLALKMGAETVFSAQDASAAMLELAKGGMTAAQIKAGALKATMTLAAAGELEMAAAATFVSNALNTFGLAAKDADAVAAALAGGANASSASVESLGLALSQVGPGAKTAGLSIQETTAVLAAFDNAGIKGSDAGTSLKTMLARLVPQTDKAKKAMRELGLNFVDSEGNFKSISNISEQLRDKMSKLSAAERSKAMTTIFGSDATRAATVLMGEGAKGIKKFIKATSDRAAAERMAKVGTEGAAGALEAFKGSVETLAIKVGMHLLPAVTRLADAGVDSIDWLDKHQRAAKVLAGVLAGLGAAIIAVNVGMKIHAAYVAAATAAAWAHVAAQKMSLSTTATWIGVKALELAAWVRSTAATVASTAAAVAHVAITKTAAAAAKVWAAAQWLLNVALKANPIGLVIAAIAALVGGLVLAYKKSETFRKIVDGALRGVATAGKWMWNSVLKPIFGFLEDAFHAQVDAAKAMKKGVGAAWSWIKDNTRKVVLWMVDKVLWMSEKILGAAVAAFGWAPEIGDKLKAAHEKVKGFRESVNAEMGRIRDEKVNVSVSAGVTGADTWRNFFNVPLPPKHATGGPITGGVPGKDSVLGLLMPGEHVLTREDVQKLGGHGGVFALRRSLKTGEFGRRGDLPAFATGGPVFGADVNKPNLARPIEQLRGRVADRAEDRVRDRLVQLVQKFLKGMAGRGSLSRAQVARGQTFARSQVGKPYDWGGVGPGGYDCSGFIAAVLNAALGMNPHSRRGTTGTMPWPGFKSGSGAFSVGWFTGNPGHMAGSIGGMGIESAGGVGVRVGGAATSVGSFPRVAHYDSGGWLKPGLTVPVNKTGRPEAVLTPEESAAFVALGKRGVTGGMNVTIHVNGARDPKGTAREIRRELLSLKRQLGTDLGIA